MDTSHQDPERASSLISRQSLRRDVKVYDGGRFVEVLKDHPTRLMADGRIGTAYLGWVYALKKGDGIALEEPVHKDVPSKNRSTPQNKQNHCSTERFDELQTIDRWFLESKGPRHYIRFDGSEAARARLVEEVNAAGLPARSWKRSAKRATNGEQYDWSIELVFYGSRIDCEQRVNAIFDASAPKPKPLSDEQSDLLSPSRRQEHRPQRPHSAAAKDSTKRVTAQPKAARTLSSQGNREVPLTPPVGNDARLPFEVLPPGEGTRGFATALRESAHHTDGELDLRRLQVLVDLQHHFAHRRSHRYASRFPTEEKNNYYVVLVIERPAGEGEDAIAISPLKGQHATFVVRHGRAKVRWEDALSRSKAEAVALGAERLTFTTRNNLGIDEYTTMLAKLIELLEESPNRHVANKPRPIPRAATRIPTLPKISPTTVPARSERPVQPTSAASGRPDTNVENARIEPLTTNQPPRRPNWRLRALEWLRRLCSRR
jgi:hypothetical protein